MREVSSRYKNLATVGIVMASCGHGCIFTACDMCEGETFRHTLVAHMKCSKFLVNDVICKYWPFAEFLGKELREQFGHLTNGMEGFLSRLHGQCHSWYCQILFFGHWKVGAAGTLGEESEQVFSFFSRYDNVTKVMSEAGRNDFLTLAILYWNSRKEKVLPRLITSRLLIAVHRVNFYKKRLLYLLAKRGLTEADLPDIHLQLYNKAFEYIKSNREDNKKTKLEIVQNEIETLYYEHSNMHDRIASVAATCKWKAHIQNKISKLNVKIKAKLVTLNALTEEDWITEINGEVYNPLTFQHFTEGAFPWEESNDASFREIFKLIDCWMLLKRNEEQPGQSMKEMSQFLHSLKKSIEFHHAEVRNLIQPDETDNFVVQEQELVEDLLPQPNKMLFNQAQASIKFAEIRRLQMVLNDALRYLKYYQHLEPGDYENMLNEEESDGDEINECHDSDSNDNEA